MVCVALLVSPFTWHYDHVLLTYPLAAAFRESRRRGYPPGATLMLVAIAGALWPADPVRTAVLVPLLVHPLPADPTTVLPFVAALPSFLPTVAMLALAGLVLRLTSVATLPFAEEGMRGVGSSGPGS
jgi:hypothetical protein